MYRILKCATVFLMAACSILSLNAHAETKKCSRSGPTTFPAPFCWTVATELKNNYPIWLILTIRGGTRYGASGKADLLGENGVKVASLSLAAPPGTVKTVSKKIYNKSGKTIYYIAHLYDFKAQDNGLGTVETRTYYDTER